MCGIVGAVRRDGGLDSRVLARMAAALEHRGPDDAGQWRAPDGRAELAARRLAIMDLSPAGRQPMTDESGEVALVFNGEIYNHRELRRELAARGCPFRGESDTETLLSAYLAWDVDCLSRLVGMFAFAIWDGRLKRLFLARDRAGEKPLFYRMDDGGLAFASELKALLEPPDAPRTLDSEALHHFLAYSYVPRHRCILQGYAKLPQAHALTFRLDEPGPRLWRYWSPPPARGDGDEAELVERLEALLHDSVRQQLQADAPLGVLLSGGVDSSLITALAARAGGTIRTFTLSFPGQRGHDESGHARLVADRFGCAHEEIEAEAASVALLPALARQFDEPLGDSSLLAMFMLSRPVSRRVKVALGGDGGDELFGGYWHYSFVRQQEAARAFLPTWLRRLGAAGVARLPLGLRGRNYLRGLCAEAEDDLVAINAYFDAPARRRLLGEDELYRGPELARTLAGGAGSPLRRAMQADFATYLCDDILTKVDRASMLASLEVRAPFLDHRLIEFAFQAPDRLRATARERKILLKRLARRLLPPEFDLARKQGLSVPLRSWLQSGWRRYFEEVLSEAEPALFDGGAIRELLSPPRGADNAHRLFALVMFELWRREYRIALP
jgi:asparagine synthase (glutamine-hydrolysing)